MESVSKLSVELYCENIWAKIVGDVKVAPYSEGPVFVQCGGKFSLRMEQFGAWNSRREMFVLAYRRPESAAFSFYYDK